MNRPAAAVLAAVLAFGCATTQIVTGAPRPAVAVERSSRVWYVGFGGLPLSGPVEDCPAGAAEVRSEFGLVDVGISAALFSAGMLAGAAGCGGASDPTACQVGLGITLPLLVSSRTLSYTCAASR